MATCSGRPRYSVQLTRRFCTQKSFVAGAGGACPHGVGDGDESSKSDVAAEGSKPSGCVSMLVFDAS